MARAVITLACLLVCLHSISRAQSAVDTTSADSTDVLVLDHDFTSPNEFARVFLQDGQVYRAELSSPDMSLQIRGLVRTTQLPRIYPFLPSDTPSGTSIVEVYPQVDGDYEIRSVARSGSAVSTRMRIYRDVKASRRRYLVRNTPGWEIGLELAGAWHSGFLQSSAPPLLGSSAESGLDVEACFSARSAPGSPGSACASWDSDISHRMVPGVSSGCTPSHACGCSDEFAQGDRTGSWVPCFGSALG